MDLLTRTQSMIGVICGVTLFVGTPLFATYATFKLLFSPLWIPLVLYFIWIYYDKDTPNLGGRRIDAFRKLFIFKWFCKYFPMKLVKTAELDPSQNYLMGYHPHGMLSLGFHGNFGGEGNEVSKVFPGIKTHVLTIDGFFRMPFFREISLSWGAVSVSKDSINFLMSKKSGGNAAVLVPGGARDVPYSEPGTDIVYLTKRKGFIKLAIQNGASLVPIYSFGESDLYSKPSQWFVDLQLAMWNRFGFALMVLLGRGIFQTRFGILPQRVPVTSVVGAPIAVEKIANPTQEEIDIVHTKYITALQALYEKHHDKYGNPNSKLVIL